MPHLHLPLPVPCCVRVGTAAVPEPDARCHRIRTFPVRALAGPADTSRLSEHACPEYTASAPRRTALPPEGSRPCRLPFPCADSWPRRVGRTSGDIRISFIGDSFVQGIGDPEYRGWVRRLLAATDGDITAFNLGIRRNTSEDVLRRCWQELLPRSRSDADHRLVVSFGSNDTIEENGTVRVAPARILAHLASLLAESGRRSIAPLVVGPPPVVGAGQDHLRRTSDLADRMAALCRAERIPFIGTTLQPTRVPACSGCVH